MMAYDTMERAAHVYIISLMVKLFGVEGASVIIGNAIEGNTTLQKLK